MKIDCFNYHLSKELIAQIPSQKRDESNLMALDRNSKKIFHRRFYDISDYLKSGDVLAINNTKVIPARIFGKDRRNREILLIKQNEPLVWETFIKPQRGLKIGEELIFDSVKGKINERTSDGTYIIQFSKELPLSNIGYAPLPPYIKRNYTKPNLHEYDKSRYQTVYAKNPRRNSRAYCWAAFYRGAFSVFTK